MDAASLPPLPPNDITTEATPNELEISSTSKLLLVQGIHQLGNGDWDAVSDLINSHPLHGEQKGTFTPRRCEELYAELSKDPEIDSDEIYPPQSPVLLGLAKKYYLELVVQIRQRMLDAEDQFRIKLGEIEEIQSGARIDEFLPSVPRRIDLANLSTEGGLPPLPGSKRSHRRREDDESESEEEEVKMEVDDVYVD